MWHEFLRAFALMLVFEGMLPFIAPQRWRLTVERMALMSHTALRAMGLFSMLAGVAVLFLVNRAAA